MDFLHLPASYFILPSHVRCRKLQSREWTIRFPACADRVTEISISSHKSNFKSSFERHTLAEWTDQRQLLSHADIAAYSVFGQNNHISFLLKLLNQISLMMVIFAPLSLFLVLTDLDLQRGDKRRSAGFLNSIGLHHLSPNWIRFFIRHNLVLLIALHPGSGRRALQAITRGAHRTVDIGQSWFSPGRCYGSNQITVHLVWDES